MNINNKNVDNLSVTFSEDTEKRYNTYDKIISATYANIFSLSKDNNRIILKDFDYSCKTSQTFLEVACMVAYMTGKEIYLQTSFFGFVRARLSKKNKHIHWIRKKRSKEIDGIDIYSVAAHEAIAFGEDCYVFDKIFEAYYERKEA